MIQVDNLTKRYVGRTAVDAISFDVGKGEVVGFLGPNGAGKTSTLRMLTGYLPPSSGTAHVAGFDVFRESLKARGVIGYMPENVPIYNDMRVREYLRFCARIHKVYGKEMRVRVGKAMELCSITDVRRKMIGSLSKGYRQRVGLAASLVHEPELLILDEPTNGLDPHQIRQVRALIRNLGEHHTILLSTHILSEVEATCDRVIILDRGQIRAIDTPSNLVGRIRTAGSVKVELKAGEEAAAKAIRKLKGVRKVTGRGSKEGWAHLTVLAESKTDVRPAISQLACDQGWPLRELNLRQASLEDVFVELTQHDAPAPGDDGEENT